MKRILLENTITIEPQDVKRGDILAVWEDEYYLEHTAVYLGRGKYFHKMGQNSSEITDINGIKSVYYGDIEYRRVVKITTENN